LSGNFLEDWFRSTEFLLSCQTPAQLPPDSGREVAFAGRSNAGKSSAINAIAGQKGLARASKTPGRTRLLNFFTLDDEHRLVDLPGYGYAKVARVEKERWQEALAYYLEERRSLAGLILVMDARHPLTDYDSQLLRWAQDAALPVHVLLTKADKFGHGAATAQLNTVHAALRARFPGSEVQLFSALNGLGVDTARARIGAWLELPPRVRISGKRAERTAAAPAKSKKSPGNKGKESGAQKKSRHRGRNLPRSGRRSG
jgi:GTP-binding protein